MKILKIYDRGEIIYSTSNGIQFLRQSLSNQRDGYSDTSKTLRQLDLLQGSIPKEKKKSIIAILPKQFKRKIQVLVVQHS